MKELYISPELNVLCFAPVERLAAEGFTMDQLLEISGNQGLIGGSGLTPGASVDGDDFDVNR